MNHHSNDVRSNDRAHHRDMPPALPHNLEAEQALLGAILVNNDAYWRVNDLISADEFYEEPHQRIFEIAAEQIEKGVLVNPIMLKGFFEGEEVIKGRTFQQYMATLAASATTIINCVNYAEAIKDAALRRRMVQIASNLLDAANDQYVEFDQLLETAENELYATSQRSVSVRPQFAATLATKVMENAATAYQDSGRLSGLTTGLSDLDRLIGPMLPGDMVVLGGATSSGKTALAHQIAEFNADGIAAENRDRYSVLYCSLEMTGEAMLARSIAQRSQVSAWRLESGRFSEKEYAEANRAAGEFQHSKLSILSIPKPQLSTIRSHAMRHRRLHGLDLLVIDHLRFLRFSHPRMGIAEGTAEITGDIKALAMQMQIPILVLAQFTRELQKRDNKRPEMSDLYGGAAIEQDADTVFFVHREEYWLERSEPREGSEEWAKWQAQLSAAEGKADVILAKRRRGSGAGQQVLTFEKKITKFFDYRPAEQVGQTSML